MATAEKREQGLGLKKRDSTTWIMDHGSWISPVGCYTGHNNGYCGSTLAMLLLHNSFDLCEVL